MKPYKNPENAYYGAKCPVCQSQAWRRQKTTGKLVCLKCGHEYDFVPEALKNENETVNIG
jgi:Zn ribbon nucleic-acid-binding protein